MSSATTDPSPAVHAATCSPGVGTPMIQGVPWPQGSRQLGTPIALRTPGGSLQPASMQSLVTWPDGSVRWGLIAFCATEKGIHTIEETDGGVPENPVVCEEDQDGVVLSNGDVRVELARTGSGPIRRLTACNHDFLTEAGQFRLAVDDATTEHEQERKITVLSSSPIRARVRIEGAHHTAKGTRRLNYRLDVELWTGCPTIRLDYHFMNLEPGRKTVDIDRIGLDWDWQLGGSTQRHFLQWVHGLYFVHRDVRNPDRVALVADDSRATAQVESSDMLLDDVDYPDYLRAPLVHSEDWLGVTDGAHAVYARQHDFAEMRPTRLASEGTQMSLDVWPPTAEQLKLRQGRTRRQIITLCFSDSSECDRGWIKDTLLLPITGGRCFVSPEYVRACGEFDQDRFMLPGSHTRFEKYIHRLLTLDMPQTMFDLGDTQDAGYQSSYIGSNHVKRLPGAPGLPKYFLAGEVHVPPWSHPEYYEPVWTNNEYDGIFALASEIMRRGRYDLFPVMERAARHNIEVDFLHHHDDRWLHRATPAHSADHTTTGAYPSHFWTQGLLAYYCLTGDIDAMEVACGLGDKIIETFTDQELRSIIIGFNREIGWPILALSYLDTYSGEDRFRPQLEDLVDYLVNFDRVNPSHDVKLSNVDTFHDFHRQLIGAFFGYASMVEGFDHYARRTGNEKVREWLITFVTQLRDALEGVHAVGDPMGPMQMQTLGMAIGYELTGDRKFLEVGMVTLQELMDSPLWHTPPTEEKPVTMTYRGLPRFLYHAIEHGLTDHLDVPKYHN